MPETPSPSVRPRFAVRIFQPHSGTAQIDSQTLADVQARLDRLDTSGDIDLDVWLESPGGIGDAAYRIALLLGQRAEMLRFVILNSARSAATLMLLSGDEIYMADSAEIGPLDAQMSIPRGVTSAREAAKTLDFVQDQAIKLSTRASRQYRGEFQVHASEALEAGSRLAAALIEGLVKTIEPATILDAQSQLEATERYARRLLRSPYLRRDQHVPAAQRHEFRKTARVLVQAYPTHDFAIDRTEAEQLHLPVLPLAEYPDAAAARAALADVLLSGRELVDIVELAPMPAAPRPSSRVVSDPGAGLPRQFDPQDQASLPRGQALMTRGRHSAHGPAGHRSRAHSAGVTGEVNLDGELPATAAIDLDDSWIWNRTATPSLQRSDRSARPQRDDERADADALEYLSRQQISNLDRITLP